MKKLKSYACAALIPLMAGCGIQEYAVKMQTNRGSLISPVIEYYADAAGNYDGIASDKEVTEFLSEARKNGKSFLITHDVNNHFMPWKGKYTYGTLSEAIDFSKCVRTPLLGLVELDADGNPIAYYEMSGLGIQKVPAPKTDIEKEMQLRMKDYQEEQKSSQ